MGEFGIGQPVRRFEDVRLLRGQGRYIADLNLPGQAYAVFLRSPHAHAEIRAIDLDAAKQAPGVLAIYTAEDVARDGLGTMKMGLPRKRPDGSPAFAPPQLGLASGRVRHVGDPIAMVIAETLAQARDAADLVAVEYDMLNSVTDTALLAAGDAAPVWEECPDNISNVFEAGDRAKVDAAIAGAAHVIKRRYVISRIFAHFMEPRGAIGVWDAGEERYTLHADVNYVHRVRNALAANIFKIPESKIRVVAGDIGGSFGTKGWQNVEHRLVLWAARKIGRPVKWQCERAEAVQADEHARDQISEAELALDAEGKFLGLRVRSINNVGAYIQSDRNLLATFSNVQTLTGCYRIPAAHVHVTCMLSNTNPTAPYRGAGRPESIYIIERLIDDAARALKLDRIELRSRNLVSAAEMPHRNGFGATYDCGDFPKGFELALQMADVAGFAARREQAAKRGRLRGLGIVNAIEKAASPGQEFAEIRFNPGGSTLVLMGTKNQGQGHETMYKQILNERLNLEPADVQFIDGDTDRVAFGLGSMGSRSAVIGGSALHVAALKIIAKATQIASHMLETAASDIEFKNGSFTVAGTDKSIALKEVAKAAFVPGKLPPGLEGGLFETGVYTAKTDTWPNGAHVCELEIDPQTGAVELCNYTVVDDVGTVINPIGVAGQIHGGVAQGLGQVLMEQVNYDPKSGQLLSGSFMDYAMPRADSTCNIVLKSNPVPTATNPLGVKGAGEAGTVGALPAGMNALLDALAPLGVADLPMPATPWRIWEAIEAAPKKGSQ